jgi:hypothetical protein
MQTLAEAKTFIGQNFKTGVRCPCCEQLVKKYKRAINSGMAMSLIRLHKMSEQKHTFYHLTDFLGNSHGQWWSDFGKLQYWDLLLSMPNTDSKKKRSGYWKITDEGKEFVKGRIKISKYGFFYNQKILGFEGPLVRIQDCLAEKFDYEKLMSGDYK